MHMPAASAAVTAAHPARPVVRMPRGAVRARAGRRGVWRGVHRLPDGRRRPRRAPGCGTCDRRASAAGNPCAGAGGAGWGSGRRRRGGAAIRGRGTASEGGPGGRGRSGRRKGAAGGPEGKGAGGRGGGPISLRGRRRLFTKRTPSRALRLTQTDKHVHNTHSVRSVRFQCQLSLDPSSPRWP